MNFLSGMLREEGGLEYKASIADTIIAIIEENPEAKEIGWLYLNYMFKNICIITLDNNELALTKYIVYK